MRSNIALATALVAACLLCTACVVDAGGVKVDPGSQQFIDPQGRVRVFHGVNAVYKIAPFHPDLTGFNTHTSLSEVDMQHLQSWGINAVRLGVMWTAVEHVKGSYNTSYLNIMRELSDTLGKYDIYTLVDSHQDVASEYFCGEGFAPWAVEEMLNGTQNHWYSKFPSPIPVDVGNGPIPNITKCQEHAFFEWYFTVGLNTVFQSLYNMPSMHEAFAGYWKAVATAFAGSDSVIGYELMNEPWPGDLYKDPLAFLEPGKQNNDNVMPLYRDVYAKIREADNDTVVVYEPAVTWTYLSQEFDIAVGPGGYADNDKQALAFHIYCTDQLPNGDPVNITACEDKLSKDYAIATQGTKRAGGGTILSEFGAVGDGVPSVDLINKIGELTDSQVQSWAYWTFKSFHDITTQNANTESFYNSNGTLQTAKVKALARTYAQAIAAIPGSITTSFDPNTAEFQLEYVVNPKATAPTIIYYNEEWWYPNGFNSTVTPSTVTLTRTSPNHLTVSVPSSAGPSTTIHIVLTPA